MFHKITPRHTGEGAELWSGARGIPLGSGLDPTQRSFQSVVRGTVSRASLLVWSPAAVAASVSLCGNANTPGVTEFLLSQTSTSAYCAQRANLPLAFWTNNTPRIVIAANGGVTIAAPDSFATVSTLAVAGGSGNNTIPIFEVNAFSLTNASSISCSNGATSGSQVSYFFGVQGSANGLTINGDSSFSLGTNLIAQPLFQGGPSAGFSWYQTGVAAAILSLANNGGMTFDTSVLQAAPAFNINALGYQVNGWPASSTTSAASAAINTTETYISASYVSNGSAQIAAGQIWKITAFGTCTSTVANLSTFTPRIGTAGTTADTALATLTCTAATSGTTIPFIFECWITLRTSTTAYSFSRLTNSGLTGISSGQIIVSAGGATTIATNDTHIGVSYKSAATTTTSTFQSVRVERCF